MTSTNSIPPLFMFGFERSGTTLLSMIVGAHPDIAVPLSVTGLFYRYHRRLDTYGNLARADDLERLVDNLLREERIRLWDVEISRDDLLDGMEPGSFADVVERCHAVYARAKNKLHWGNLDIATLDDLDIANSWFPDARFLHIVRDGRDVALSHETMPYGAANTLETAITWRQRLQVNLKMGAVVGPARYHVVRYEDLVRETESTLQRICEFFGTRYARRMLDYPSMVDEKIPDDRRWLWPALNQPPDPSRVYGWRSKMSSAKRIVFEGEAREMLSRLEYETYDHVPKSSRAYAYELWCFLGRGGRMRRISKRLGFSRPSKLERDWRASRQRSTNYENVQKESFGSLVERGTYDKDFQHGAKLRSFFRASLEHAFQLVGREKGISVLECGCGPGAWLDEVFSMNGPYENLRLYGFDLTSQMVDVACERLEQKVPRSHLKVGDLRDPSSYVFDDENQLFDVIFSVDVIQQLPRRLQREAIETMLVRLAPGGCAVIVDHDRWSRYGIKMGVQKFLTKYLRLGLVPDYYCNARYPALTWLGRQLSSDDRFSTDLRVALDGRKRALLIKSRADASPAMGAPPSPKRTKVVHGVR